MPATTNRPFLGGNWKMNLRLASAVELAEEVHAALSAIPLASKVDLVVFPPACYLQAVGRAIGHGPPSLGAQDLSAHLDGAFTGQVSGAMLDDLGCGWVLVGHSERRHGIGESNAVLRTKLERALAAGLKVVLCVGETLAEREGGHARSVLVGQVRAGLSGLDRGVFGSLVLAYEPVWAIGTGRTARAEDAAEAHRWIREEVADLYDPGLAAATRVVYGGSVTAENAAELFSRPEIDGGLVGGASLKVDSFAAIGRAAASRASHG
ncbi:MAG: triose-phosphate isomerase [Phycisphaerae bacterium]|nr:triose-phosphate isomerase [Phycisphaerae bacterium]